MTEIEEINHKLDLIKELVKRKKSIKSKEVNGLLTTKDRFQFMSLLEDFKIKDSSVYDFNDVLILKKKLESRKKHLNQQDKHYWLPSMFLPKKYEKHFELYFKKFKSKTEGMIELAKKI